MVGGNSEAFRVSRWSLRAHGCREVQGALGLKGCSVHWWLGFIPMLGVQQAPEFLSEVRIYAEDPQLLIPRCSNIQA